MSPSPFREPGVVIPLPSKHERHVITLLRQFLATHYGGEELESIRIALAEYERDVRVSRVASRATPWRPSHVYMGIACTTLAIGVAMIAGYTLHRDWPWIGMPLFVGATVLLIAGFVNFLSAPHG